MPAIRPGGPGRVTIRGELASFNQRTDDGWGFGSLRMEGVDELVQVTGKVLGARPGDSLECTGSWVDHPTFGRQFKIISTVTSVPSSVEGVRKWLADTLPGIGEKRATALIEHFGGVEALWQVIEHEPARLAEVAGVTTAAAQAMHGAYMKARDSRDHMVALRGWGLTDNQIQRCLKEWKTLDAIVKRIKTNPYELCHCVSGFGFLRADKVAMLAGIAPNSPERIEAGLVFTLDNATTEGHCWIYGGALQRIAANDTLHVTFDEVARGIVRATKTKLIMRRGKRIYCARMEAAEGKAARALDRLLTHSNTASHAATGAGEVFQNWIEDFKSGAG